MDKMTLIYKTAEVAGCAIIDAERLLEAMTKVITTAFISGETVELDPNFGQFVVRKRDGDVQINTPRTQKSPHFIVVFKVSCVLKKKLKLAR